MAMDPTRPLAWEPPYAMGAALEKDKRQKKILKSKIKKERKEGKEKVVFVRDSAKYLEKLWCGEGLLGFREGRV